MQHMSYAHAHPTTQQPRTARLALNEYLQQWRRLSEIRWTSHSEGRRERPTWTVTCYLSDIRYGTGQGLTKSEAKEQAARETLDIIHRQHVAVWSMEYFNWATAYRSSGYTPSHAHTHAYK